MTVDYYKYSDSGERPVNEDSVGSYQCGDLYAFSLCDGLGGHGSGEIASKIAVEAMLNVVDENGSSENVIADSFQKANYKVLQGQNESASQKDMKTTGTLLIIKGNTASWGHIGDSRIYRFSKKKFVERTLDHSIPQMLASTGQIKEKDIRHHEDRNRLLRCIPWTNKQYDIDETDVLLQQGDCFLMMSDGFWDWVDEKAMRKAIKKEHTAEGIAKYLIEIAFKEGKGKNMDNLSLIVIKIN